MARCSTLKTVVDIALQAALAMLTPHAELPTGSDAINAHGGRSWAVTTVKREFENNCTPMRLRIARCLRIEVEDDVELAEKPKFEDL